MRAIQTIELGKASIQETAEPELTADTIIVRPTYVGCNPCDWLITDLEMVFRQNQIVGCDWAGVVESIGAGVKTPLKPGDKVFGAVAAAMGPDQWRGAFADRIPAYPDLCFPLPKALEEPAAATLGVALSTICISFYQHFGFPMPQDDPNFGRGKPFFVWAGSSTTGLMAIQYAKMSGFKVITTCSPRNFDIVKSRGADEVYDYHDVEKCTHDIKASVGDELEYAYICVMGDVAPKICSDVMSSKGGKYVTIVGGSCPRDDVQTHTVTGQALMCPTYATMQGIKQQTAEQKAMADKFWKWTLKLLEDGRIQPPPIQLEEGLEGALKGVNDLRGNKVSGKKVVSRLQ